MRCEKRRGRAAADERGENRNAAVTYNRQDFFNVFISYRNLALGVYMDLGNALNSTGTVAYIVDGDHNTGSNYKVNIGELVIRTCLFFF